MKLNADCGLYYDEEDDRIVFYSQTGDLDSYATVKLAIDRQQVLRELAAKVLDYGDDFAVFEEMGEKWEMTFLTPPTSECIVDDEEEEE